MISKTTLSSAARVCAALSLLATAAFAAGCGGSGTTDPVKKPALVSLAVTPANPSIAIAATQAFTATGTFADNSTKDLTATVTWSSGTTATATISTTGLATGVAAGTSTIKATSGAVNGSTLLTVVTGNPPPPPPPVTLVSIAVTPNNPTINKGATQQLTATGTYSDASTKDLSPTVTWASATTATATISASGLATGVAKGTSVITATSGTVSGNTLLTVTAPANLVSIAVTPTAPAIAKGTTVQLTATGTFDDGTTKDLSATATWTSATAATATVSAAGLATGVAGGTSVITATSGTISGTTTLTVSTSTLVSIAVTPATPTIATGTKQQFVATGTFKDSVSNAMTTQDLSASVTWASATVATATITAAGLASAVAPGTTVISATSGTIVGMVTLTVKKADLVSIAVTPATPSIAKGTTQKFIATGTFADTTTQDLSAEVAWTSATPATATISSAGATIGVATGVAMGTTVISAKLGTITGMTTLTVTGVNLVSIAVTAVLPTQSATPKIARGTKVQLIATGTYTDSSTQDITGDVTWTSATVATATVSNAAGSKGLATGVAGGTSVMSATIGTGATAIVGKVTLTVTIETLVSIVVTPATHTIAKGTKQQFVATGFFTDASKQDLTTTVTWSSGTAATATISNAAGSKGLASGVAAGTSVITATLGAITDTATLTVSVALVTSIAITPPAPMLALGTKVPLVATGTFTDQTKQDLTALVTWQSATPAVATVSNAAGTIGQASAVTKGTSVITATYVVAQGQNVTATVTLTVADATLKSIAITATQSTIEKGTTLQYTATGTFTDASTQDLTKVVTWKSDKTTVATISNAAGSIGLATAVATGTATISATSSVASGSIVGSIGLTVDDGKLVSIAVTPATPSIAKGTKLQMIATGTFDDGAKQDITNDVDWASATAATATVDDTGLATANVAGTAKITASQGAISGNTTLTVTNAQLLSIVLDPHAPNAPSIAKGTTQAFKATGFFDDTTTQNLTDTATWASSVVTVASISNAADSNGVASGVAMGTTNITASVVTPGGTVVSAPVILTVTAATLVSVAITPAPASVAKGATLNLIATGTYTDGTTQVLTNNVTWASATTASATISNAAGSHGRATGVAVGTSDISATSSVASGSKVGHITLTVTPAVIVSIAVTPAAPTIAKTATQQFVATATMTDGTKVVITATATWASATPATATISAAGLASGVAAGTTVISAKSGAITGQVTLTVTN